MAKLAVVALLEGSLRATVLQALAPLWVATAVSSLARGRAALALKRARPACARFFREKMSNFLQEKKPDFLQKGRRKKKPKKKRNEFFCVNKKKKKNRWTYVANGAGR